MPFLSPSTSSPMCHQKRHWLTHQPKIQSSIDFLLSFFLGGRHSWRVPWACHLHWRCCPGRRTYCKVCNLPTKSNLSPNNLKELFDFTYHCILCFIFRFIPIRKITFLGALVFLGFAIASIFIDPNEDGIDGIPDIQVLSDFNVFSLNKHPKFLFY